MDARGGAALPRGGLSVTRLGLGCAQLGGLYQTMAEADAFALVDAAWDAGIRYFDTAPYYGFTLSERRLGAALRDLPRDELVVSTKIGRWMTPLRPGMDLSTWRSGGLNFVPTFDYSYDGVHRSLEQSLLRLGMNLAMYALCTDYKDDAVHLPFIMKRRT